MLGVRWSGVTVALNKLEREEVIEQQRGRITVLDRTKLEQAACPCHGIVRTEFERVLG